MGVIGGAIGAVGRIFGGISASKAMKKMRQGIEAQRRRNEDWYNRRFNEDATQRADAQRILTKTEELIRNRNKATTGRSAVMGGDDAGVAMEKERNAKALADATSDIVAMGEARKDNIEATYLQNDNAYREQLNNLEMQKAQNIGGAVQGLTNAAASIPF